MFCLPTLSATSVEPSSRTFWLRAHLEISTRGRPNLCFHGCTPLAKAGNNVGLKIIKHGELIQMGAARKIEKRMSVSAAATDNGYRWIPNSVCFKFLCVLATPLSMTLEDENCSWQGGCGDPKQNEHISSQTSPESERKLPLHNCETEQGRIDSACCVSAWRDRCVESFEEGLRDLCI